MTVQIFFHLQNHFSLRGKVGNDLLSKMKIVLGSSSYFITLLVYAPAAATLIYCSREQGQTVQRSGSDPTVLGFA